MAVLSVIGSVLVLLLAVGLTAQTLIVNAEKIMSALAGKRFSGDMSVFVVFVEGKSRRNSPVVLRHARTSPAPAMRRETHALAA